ncbi:hypothetical protein [Streptomyces sp. NPDC056672]|uniref:hypothetical protein n=1 Tax=Streptomyces sp. NPDC056672 TaxID=3345906 RepID=UPI003675BDEF
MATASLVCNRDTWEFITSQSSRHPHFRMPPKITDREENRIAAALSGRSLIAVLICLFNTQETAPAGDADWALATTLYERISQGLITLAAAGTPVTITLDDRAPGTSTEDEFPPPSSGQQAPYEDKQLPQQPGPAAEADDDTDQDTGHDPSAPQE